MIDIKELRIGNWVLLPYTQEKPFLIAAPREIELAYILLPITPNEQILEAIGFRLNEDNSLKDLQSEYNFIIPVKGENTNEITYYVSRTENAPSWGTYTVNGFWATNNFTYLHQLQNLLYDLCGDEIKFTHEQLESLINHPSKKEPSL